VFARIPVSFLSLKTRGMARRKGACSDASEPARVRAGPCAACEAARFAPYGAPRGVPAFAFNGGRTGPEP
jgi:hypothetical protein